MRFNIGVLILNDSGGAFDDELFYLMTALGYLL